MNKKTTPEQHRQYELKTKCTDLLLEILEYEKGIKLPTITYKKLEEYRETCGFEVVYETIKKQRESIEWALRTKEFRSEINKINYIFAIIQNHVPEVLRDKRAEEKKRKLEESLEPVSAEAMMVSNNNKKKVKDISAYVEADD